jgi:hypothetical protein
MITYFLGLWRLTFFFVLAHHVVAAQASNNVAQCIIAKCSAQVTACYEDPVCLSAAECVRTSTPPPSCCYLLF